LHKLQLGVWHKTHSSATRRGPRIWSDVKRGNGLGRHGQHGDTANSQYGRCGRNYSAGTCALDSGGVGVRAGVASRHGVPSVEMALTMKNLMGAGIVLNNSPSSRLLPAGEHL